MKAIFCPRCSSPSIHPYIGGMTGTYQCRTCGYMGSLVIQQEFTKTVKEEPEPPGPREPRKAPRRGKLGFEPKQG